jgi:hypothetical protein
LGAAVGSIVVWQDEFDLESMAHSVETFDRFPEVCHRAGMSRASMSFPSYAISAPVSSYLQRMRSMHHLVLFWDRVDRSYRLVIHYIINRPADCAGIESGPGAELSMIKIN